VFTYRRLKSPVLSGLGKCLGRGARQHQALPARYRWAVIIARIYDVSSLLCLHCSGEMRLMGFVNEGAEIKKIHDYIGEPSTPPNISQARSQPLWDA